MTASTEVRPPQLDSADLAEAIAEIADDAKRRREAGGGRPERAVRLIRQLRLGAVRIPTDAGGGGYSKRELFSLIIRLAEADPDVPHIIRVHYGFVEERWRLRHVEQGTPWLSEIISGRLFAGAGSELSGHAIGTHKFDATLRRDGTGYRITGRKFYCTGSLYADYLRISATDEADQPVSAVIPVDRPGVVHADDWDGIGQRETGSGTTILEDVRIEPGELLPRHHWGDRTNQPGGSQPQLVLHAIATGILRSIVSDAAELVRSRARTYSWAGADQPRHDPQLLQIIGEISAAAFIGEAAVLAAADGQQRSAEHYFQHTDIDPELEHEASLLAAQTKVVVEGIALRAASDLYGVGGASAVRESTHLDRHWRNLRTLFSHNPTAYKARAIGDYVVNGASLPTVGFF
ncbi:hypothetical protein [Frankia tisae]|uniref:hypothetical protein n=1 Tax=Frankia tisae TaxID=2950104 RepID=UPI0021C1FB09|nr:hypothetical protein [Frankia tisae]